MNELGYSQPKSMMSPGTFFASAATIGSLIVLLGKSSKTEKAVAMQFLAVAAPVALGALFQLQ